MKPTEHGKFKDLRALTNWLTGVICLSILWKIVLMCWVIVNDKYLVQFVGKLPTPEIAKIAYAYKTDWLLWMSVSGIIGFFYLVLFLVWVYRVAHNARSLSNDPSSCSPGWAVGWFLVPIANFWKPYQVIKQIMKTGLPAQVFELPKYERRLLIWFWVFFIMSALIAYGMTNPTYYLFEHKDMQLFIVILSDFLTILLLTAVYRLQTSKSN